MIPFLKAMREKTMTPEQLDDFNALIKEIDAKIKDDEKWMVGAGDQVSMGVHGKYVVSSLILGKELEEKIDPGQKRIWKLYSLVDVSSGSNWCYPIPAMSEGIVDLRRLVGVRDGEESRVVSMEFIRESRLCDGRIRRAFRAVERDGFTFPVTVCSRHTYNR